MVLAIVAVLGAVDPMPAGAGIGIGPVDDFTAGLKDFATAPLDAVAGVGGDILQSALEWLLGGFETVVTVWLVKFLVTIHVPIGGQLQATIAPLIVVGGFFLVVGLIASVADGYREIIAGTDTAPRVIGQAVFRVVGLALLMAAWPWVVPLAVETANGMTGYVLSDAAVAEALRETYAAGKLNPILWLLAVIFMATAMLILVVLKFIIAIALACLFVGGPALIGFAALPGVGPAALSMATRGLVVLMAIPLAWTVVFVAWASVSGGMFDAFDGAGVVAGLMGPGLFVAGLVVMLALTKKLLSMASFGLRGGVPGAGVARLIAARAALGAAGAAGAPGRGAPGGEQDAGAPVSGGGGEAVKGARAQQAAAQVQQPTPAPQPSAQQPTRQRADRTGLLSAERRGGGAGPVDRAHRRAVDEATRRENRAAEANGLVPTRDGVFIDRGDRVPDGQRSALAARAGEVRQQHGGDIPAEVLREKTELLSRGERSAAAASAQEAQWTHPDNPASQQREYSRAISRQYAGRADDDAERDAAAYLAAASPQTVQSAFKADYESFGHSTGQPGTSGYDPQLFNFARSPRPTADRPGPARRPGGKEA